MNNDLKLKRVRQVQGSKISCSHGRVGCGTVSGGSSEGWMEREAGARPLKACFCCLDFN